MQHTTTDPSILVPAPFVPTTAVRGPRRRGLEILKTPISTPGGQDLRAPCPKCGYENPVVDEDCKACGLVFAKYFAREQEKRRREEEALRALAEAPTTIRPAPPARPRGPVGTRTGFGDAWPALALGGAAALFATALATAGLLLLP